MNNKCSEHMNFSKNMVNVASVILDIIYKSQNYKQKKSQP